MTAAFIETFTGRRFQPLEPRVADVCLEDIAHALSNQGRYSGHTREFYSVAEHSIHVSRVVKLLGGSPMEQLEGLLHDSTEAYLVDLPTPLKQHPTFGAFYRHYEARLYRCIAKAFVLPNETEPAIVKRADRILLATEVRDLMPGRAEHWDGQLTEDPIAREFLDLTTTLTPHDAEHHFHALYDALLWEIDSHDHAAAE